MNHRFWMEQDDLLSPDDLTDRLAKEFDPDQPRDEDGKWSGGGGGGGGSSDDSSKLSGIDRVPESQNMFGSGPEIATTSVWPDAKGKMRILGHSKPSGQWEQDQEINPDDLIPSQHTLTVSGVQGYIDNPGKSDFSGISERPSVSLYEGRYHINTGHHRLAAAKLRGVDSIPVKVTFFENRNGRPVQVKPPRVSKIAEDGPYNDRMITIVKVDDEQRLVYGWASVIEENGTIVEDSQGDVIDEPTLVKAAHDFVGDYRAGKLMHRGRRVADVVDSVVMTKSLQRALGIDLKKVGWFIGMKIRDDALWADVKAGKYRAFSIGGSGTREPV